MPSGVVVQDLPFDVELKKFIVEYYATGMPKLFASDVVLHDRRDGTSTKATVKVNEPVTYRGVTLYQSSFEDGGSSLKLKLRALQAAHDTPLDGKVNGTTTLTADGEKFGLEFTGLRVINVENFADDGKDKNGTDVRKVDLVGRLEQHLGSGANLEGKKTLRNVGPSFSYKLRDASGQAREYNNYMLPLELDGHRVILLGVRDTLSDSFRYLRIPVDGKDSMEGWLALRRGLADPAQRLQAARLVRAGRQPAGQAGDAGAAGSDRAAHADAVRRRRGPEGRRPRKARRWAACRRCRSSSSARCPRPNAPACPRCCCASSTAACSSSTSRPRRSSAIRRPSRARPRRPS